MEKEKMFGKSLFRKNAGEIAGLTSCTKHKGPGFQATKWLNMNNQDKGQPANNQTGNKLLMEYRINPDEKFFP